MSIWTFVEDQAPPENVVVDTLSPGGIQQPLVRVGRLWYLSDMSSYVYYTPLYWSIGNDDQN